MHRATALAVPGNPERRLRRALGRTALVSTLGLGVAVAPQATAHAALGDCPSGWSQRAIVIRANYTAYVFLSPDHQRVVAKVVNRHPTFRLTVEAWHGRSRLDDGEPSVVAPGASWCSYSAPQPITLWTLYRDGVFPVLTYPAGAPISPPE